MDFKKSLKENRKRVGLSQEELADKLSVSRQTISKWESGESYPSTSHIFELTKYLKCNLNELISNNSSPDSHSKTLISFRRNHFYTVVAVLALLGFSIITGCCASMIQRPERNNRLSDQLGMIESDIINLISSDFLDSVIDTVDKDAKKAVLGYGITDDTGTFYIKCKYCNDGVLSAAIIYFYKNSSGGYTYSCEYPEDFNYCPAGEYHII